MWRVLIAEDQAIVRQGLKMMLEQDEKLKVIAEAENGREAISLLEKTIVDLAILDIRMPEMNGIETLSIIKKRWPNVKVLMLTTFNDDEYALQSLKEGANGFLLKTSDGKQLINSVYSCLTGGVLIQ
jgi:DNA-binding NarL/FixJ family response regulator